MAAHSEQPLLARFTPLVLLKYGTGDPLFIVHGLGGAVAELAPLGRLMPSLRPVYAIQARGVDGDEPPFDSLVDMANYYLDNLKDVQPRGPICWRGIPSAAWSHSKWPSSSPRPVTKSPCSPCWTPTPIREAGRLTPALACCGAGLQIKRRSQRRYRHAKQWPISPAGSATWAAIFAATAAHPATALRDRRRSAARGSTGHRMRRIGLGPLSAPVLSRQDHVSQGGNQRALS